VCPTSVGKLAQLPRRQGQRVPAFRVALRQRVVQSPVPNELLPHQQLVNWDVQRDVDRLALLGVIGRPGSDFIGPMSDS
jgi:hypothetical protein